MIRFILKYIKMRLNIIGFFIALWILLPFVNYLYQYPIGAALYSLMVLTFLFTIYTIIDGVKQYNKSTQLRKKIDNASIYKVELTPPANLIEEEYNAMITRIYNNIEAAMHVTDYKNKERTDYFITWVHQIKTPISAMKLLVQKNKENGVKKDSIALLEQEIFRIEQYVEMALQYLRIEHIENDLTIAEFSLDKVIPKVIKKYSTIFIQKKISLKYEKVGVFITSDEKWFALMLEQIISNALKYTNSGSIAIRMEGANTLIVEDTGIGISQQDINRIFESGFTGHNGRLNQKSSGIGLFLVKKIANYLAIEIKIDSKPREGTRVRFVFPNQMLKAKR